MFESLKKVDWSLLHRQKLALLTMLEHCHPSEAEALSGIIHLLDALQDDAATRGLWTFPREAPLSRCVRSKHSTWSETAARIIYGAYPDHDLLPIEPPGSGETISQFKLTAEDAADTLFLFLCREADDDIDAREYVARLDRAIRDIEAVRAGFESVIANRSI